MERTKKIIVTVSILLAVGEITASSGLLTRSRAPLPPLPGQGRDTPPPLPARTRSVGKQGTEAVGRLPMPLPRTVNVPPTPPEVPVEVSSWTGAYATGDEPEVSAAIQGLGLYDDVDKPSVEEQLREERGIGPLAVELLYSVPDRGPKATGSGVVEAEEQLALAPRLVEDLEKLHTMFEQRRGVSGVSHYPRIKELSNLIAIVARQSRTLEQLLVAGASDDDFIRGDLTVFNKLMRTINDELVAPKSVEEKQRVLEDLISELKECALDISREIQRMEGEIELKGSPHQGATQSHAREETKRIFIDFIKNADPEKAPAELREYRALGEELLRQPSPVLSRAERALVEERLRFIVSQPITGTGTVATRRRPLVVEEWILPRRPAGAAAGNIPVEPVRFGK